MTWAWLGTIHAYRTRGKETLQPLEQPLKIALMGSAATHYLGLSSGWSAALGGLFLIAWEVGAFLAGRFDYKAGVLSEQQRQLNLQDPFKVEALALLRRVAQTVDPRWTNGMPMGPMDANELRAFTAGREAR